MADSISVKWEGFGEVKKALERWEKHVVAAIAKAVDENGEDLLQKSQALAPLLTGDLAGSGTKGKVVVDGTRHEISVTVGFHKAYAARQHEAPVNPGPLTASKPLVDGMQPGRKYLERPLRKYIQRYRQNIADAVRDVTGGARR